MSDNIPDDVDAYAVVLSEIVLLFASPVALDLVPLALILFVVVPMDIAELCVLEAVISRAMAVCCDVIVETMSLVCMLELLCSPVTVVSLNVAIFVVPCIGDDVDESCMGKRLKEDASNMIVLVSVIDFVEVCSTLASAPVTFSIMAVSAWGDMFIVVDEFTAAVEYRDVELPTD